jgi:hypothetical protein
MFSSTNQAWNDAVARNRLALKVVAAKLLALLAAYGGVEAVKVPRAVHASVWRLLQPAESALRRLIFIAARDVKIEVKPLREKPAPSQDRGVVPRKRQRAARPPAFQLYDPRVSLGQRRRSTSKVTPRIWFFEPDPPFAPPFLPPRQLPAHLQPQPETQPEAAINARQLCRRLQSFAAALEDVPKQAQRMARWRFRRETSKRPSFTSPIRRGRPPGFRKRPIYEVDHVLADCHKYAQGVMMEQLVAYRESRDTS